MAGKDAYGSFSVDSSHHRFNRYRLADNARGCAGLIKQTEAETKASRGKTDKAPEGK